MFSRSRVEPASPVEPRHYQDVAGLEAFKHLGAIRLLSTLARSVFAPDTFSLKTLAAPAVQSRALRSQSLAVGRDAGISVSLHFTSIFENDL